MTIKSILSNYKADQLGASKGKYLKFEEGAKKWSVVQLNCLEKFLRWIGIGYSSTRLEFVAKNLSTSTEQNLDKDHLDLLKKIHASWEKTYPKSTSPLKDKLEASPAKESSASTSSTATPSVNTSSTKESNGSASSSAAPSVDASSTKKSNGSTNSAETPPEPAKSKKVQANAPQPIQTGNTATSTVEAEESESPISVDNSPTKKLDPWATIKAKRINPAKPEKAKNIKPLLIQVGKTTISIEGGELTKSGVAGIVLPTISPKYTGTCFEDTYKREGVLTDISAYCDLGIETRVNELWKATPEEGVPFDPIEDRSVNPASKGPSIIFLPKRPHILKGFLIDAKKHELESNFLRGCLESAVKAGVRTLAYFPLGMERGDLEKFTALDLAVIEKYVKENPAAFDSIKLIYNFANETSADMLERAISTALKLDLTHGKVVS